MRDLLVILLLLVTVAAGAPAMRAEEQQQPISADDVDRELVVRFSRAYGMARGAVDRRQDIDRDTDLQDPEQLNREVRDELYQIMDLNGLSRYEWQGMLARMEHDPELRDRVESLSTPFRYQ